jgi:hypothetical protein
MALAGAVAFVLSMLGRTGGVPSPPLDDTYIYLQYARRLAGGHLLSYVEGAAPSTGASSYHHLALLVPGWWVGFHGASFVWYAIGLGAIYLGVTLAAGARVAATLGAPSRVPVAAGLAWLGLAGLNGHLLWAAFTGMDTVLFAAGLLLVLAGLARNGPAPGWTWILAGSLPLFRPEGIPLGFLAILLMYLAALRRPAAAKGAAATGGTTAPARGRLALRRLAFGLPALLLLLAPALLNRMLTGSATWDSMAVKSIFAETRPDVMRELLLRLPVTWRDIVLLHVNDFRSGSWGPSAAALLTTLTAVGLAAGSVVLLRGRRGPAGVLLILWLAAGIVLGGLSPGWHSHYFRYQIPYAPLAALVTVAGWSSLAGLLPWRHRGPAVAGAGLAAALLLWPGVRLMHGLYGRNCANIHEQQATVGRWIDANLHPEARVGLNDAGAIAYYGNRRIVDFVGLTTHGFAAASRMGAGGLFEKLESLPVEERPQYMAIYPRWFPSLVATGLAGKILFSADLVDNTICGDRLKRVYRIDWSRAESGALPVLRGELIRDFGLTLVDEVDVSDLESEAAHGYAWTTTFRDRLREFPSGPEVRKETLAADGGRAVSESEEMRIRARPGQWLILVMRTETDLQFELDVLVNGRPAGRLMAERLALAWTEPLLQIPDSLVVDSLLTVTLRQVPGASAGDRYNSYHYWFIQP